MSSRTVSVYSSNHYKTCDIVNKPSDENRFMTPAAMLEVLLLCSPEWVDITGNIVTLYVIACEGTQLALNLYFRFTSTTAKKREDYRFQTKTMKTTLDKIDKFNFISEDFYPVN